MSIVKKEVCKLFKYPTPFELHFSQMHILVEYLEEKDVQYNVELAKDYANYMLGKCSE